MIRDFIEKNNIECICDSSLKKYNTYRLDIKAKYIVFPKDVMELKKIISYVIKNRIKYFVLGNGSNIVLACDYYDGVVIKLDKFNDIEIRDNIVAVGAGYSLIKLSIETINNSLAGLEFAAGIPGSVGGSVAMNAGAYNSSMADVIKEVIVLDDKQEVRTLSNDDLNYSYRNSFLKEHTDYIVLKAIFKLEHGDKEELLKIINDRKERRMISQPLDKPSAGSVFRNPTGMYAGALIEECGLKGYSIKGAKVSEKHANFIINDGDATGYDIEKLIYYIRDKVKERFDVELKFEQIIIK